MKDAMLVSGILDPDAQSPLLLPMIPTILSRQKGFLCHATRQTRINWPRFIALPASQNDLNRTTDMQADSLGESGSQTMQTCPLYCRCPVYACVWTCSSYTRNLPNTSRPIRTTHSLFTQRWRSKRFTQVRDEVRKLTSCRRDFASTSQFTTY